MTIAHDFSAFKALLGSYLALTGFSGEGDIYWRRIRDTLVVLEIQKDRRRSSKSETTFTINLGISIDALRAAIRNPSFSAAVPPSEECHWRIRLGRLLPAPKDVWWSVHDEQTVQTVYNEITLGLIEYALPKVYAIASSEELIRAWRAGRGQGLTEYERRTNLARLLCLFGRIEEAKIAIRELKDASVGKPWGVSARQDIATLQRQFPDLVIEDSRPDQ